MKLRYLMLAFVALLIAALPARSFAQCGSFVKPAAFALQRATSTAHFQLASGAPQVQDFKAPPPGPGGYPWDPIVGLWKLDFEDPSANYSDKGYAVWHSDHTEFMNSTRPPSTGAVCQGVWERVGNATYQLNHFAMGYGDNVHLTNIIQIKELVTVDRSGNKFSGTFTLTAYDPTSHGFQFSLKGTITGERVTIDTGVDSQNF